jgi:uncharacterized protein (TIGR02001 family)
MLTSIRGLVAATLLSGSALVATPVLADETAPPSAFTISGNVALVTDYRFRGLSQSAGDPAIQGTININHSSGLYAGVWSSSIDFSNFPSLDPVYGNQEVDLYAGWTGAVASGVTADVGLLYYAYPSGHVGKAEFFEPYASLSGTLGPATAKLGVAYAWKQAALDFNADGQNDDNFYVFTELGGGVPDTPISVLAHVGFTKGALSPNFATGKTLSYKGGFDYSVGATYNITPKLSIGAAYQGVDGVSIDGYSNDAVIGTLKLTF